MTPPSLPPVRPVVQCATPEKSRFEKRSDVLAFLGQTGVPLKEKSKAKSEWNKANPTAAITTSDWDFNAEKRALAPRQPLPATSTATAIATPLPPTALTFHFLTPEQLPSIPDEEMALEAPEKKTAPGKTKKKKPKAEEKYKKGSVYNGRIGSIGLDHLPSSDARAEARAGKKRHARRAQTMTVFTEPGYDLAKALLSEHRQGRGVLRVTATTPGGDVHVMDPTSGLKLGIHASQPDAKVYPLTNNKEEYIEKG